MIKINGVTYYGEEAERRSISMLKEALEPEWNYEQEREIAEQDEPPQSINDDEQKGGQ